MVNRPMLSKVIMKIKRDWEHTPETEELHRLLCEALSVADLSELPGKIFPSVNMDGETCINISLKNGSRYELELHEIL